MSTDRPATMHPAIFSAGASLSEVVELTDLDLRVLAIDRALSERYFGDKNVIRNAADIEAYLRTGAVPADPTTTEGPTA